MNVQRYTHRCIVIARAYAQTDRQHAITENANFLLLRTPCIHTLMKDKLLP